MVAFTSVAWSDDVQRLRELADGNTPTGLISQRLGRSEDAVRANAQAEVISLGPRTGRRTATCRSDQAHSDVMDDGWTCGKCDGAADVALHSRLARCANTTRT